MDFLFISRHEPTQQQHELAHRKGITLHWHGDADGFTVDPAWVDSKGDYQGVVVVHAAAALNLCSAFYVGVFENANRAPVGEKPQFETKKLHVYYLSE